MNSLTDAVADLRQFYGSRQGRVVRRLLSPHILRAAENSERLSIIGYGQPWMSQLSSVQRSVIPLSLPFVGALPDTRQPARWHMSIADPHRLPLRDRTLDTVILVHALEFLDPEMDSEFLREIWRVLSIGGCLQVIVPSYTGLWSLSSSIPWGKTRSFSSDSLSRCLSESLFTIEARTSAVYMPPSKRRLIHLSAPMLERLGRRLGDAFGSVWVFEARKAMMSGKVLLTEKEAKRSSDLAVVMPRQTLTDERASVSANRDS